MNCFSFWPFAICEGIPSNQKIIIGLDSYSNQRLYILPHLDYTSRCIDYLVESCKITVFLFGSMLPLKRLK